MILIILIILLLSLLLWYLFTDIIKFTVEIFYPPSKIKRLSHLLNIIQTIPIYKNKIPSNITRWNFENFKKITPITKTEIVNNLSKTYKPNTLTTVEIYNYLNSPYTHFYFKNNNKYLISTTSGTSGEMGVFINDWKSWVQSQATLFSDIFYNNIHLLVPSTNIKMVFILVDNGHFMSRKMAKPVINIFMNIFIEITILSIFDMNKAEKINNIKPDILHTYPSVLDEIIDDLDSGIKIITTGSESISDNLKEKIKKKTSKLIETYGSTECVFMASSCKYGTLHVSNKCIIELVKDGKVINDINIPSDYTLMTNLINTFQPLVRYRIDDSLEYVECMCNSKKKAVIVHGRSDDIFYLIDTEGTMQKHSPISIESIFVSIPGKFVFQVIHYRQNCIQIYIMTDDNNILELVDRNFNDYLIKFKLNISYNITKKDIYRNNKHGKMKQIISYV